MKKFRFIALLLVAIICFGCVTVSADSRSLVFYLSPKTMNDVTGEIVVDVKVKNFTYVSENYYDEVKAFSFVFTYDNKNFTPITNQSGKIELIVDEGTLLKTTDYITCESDMSKGQIELTYLNKAEKQIVEDGVICRFKIKAMNVNSLWNSFDRYPFRFVPGTIFAVLSNSDDVSVKTVGDAEGIDTTVGGYNEAPSLIPSPIDKKVEFTNGKSDFYVNGGLIETDATPYISNGVLMIPLRFFAEAIGMKVEWNGDVQLAAAYGQFKSLHISMIDNNLFINSALQSVSANPEEIDGRTYIPADAIKQLYENVEYSFNGEVATIYIP